MEEPVAEAITVITIAYFIQIGVQRPGGDLMKQRLPDMSPILVHQNDVVSRASITGAEPGHKFQPTRSASDYDDLRLFHCLAYLERAIVRSVSGRCQRNRPAPGCSPRRQIRQTGLVRPVALPPE